MNNVESFREYLLGHFPTLKLPKGKKYVEFPVYKGILVCCMVKKDGINVYLYSGGRVPAKEIFDKLNSLGVSGKVLNDKYTITPMPGSRNPNVVRIDLLIPYSGRDLEDDDLRKEVLDLYTQLIDQCMPLNPDAVFHKIPYEKDNQDIGEIKKQTVEMNDLEVKENAYYLKGESNLFSGIAKCINKNGQEFSQVLLKDGRMWDGIYTTFHVNGEEKHYVIEYKDGEYVKMETFELGGESKNKMHNQTNMEITFEEGSFDEAAYEINGEWHTVNYSESEQLDAFNINDYMDSDSFLAMTELSAYAWNNDKGEKTKIKFTISITLKWDGDENDPIWMEIQGKSEPSAVEFPIITLEESTITEIDGTDEENINLLDSVWSLKRTIGDEDRILFLKNSKFKLFKTQKEGIKIPVNEGTTVNDNNSWSLNKNDILISLNNGFVKFNGKLNNEGNKMEGTFTNEPGTNKGNWQANPLDNLHSCSKNELQIVVEGKFHFYKYGSLNDEHKTSLEKVLKHVEGCNGIESLIAKLWYGNTKEIFSEVPEEQKDPIIKKLESKGMGGVWEEFNVFYTTPVIDEDNKITILIDKKPFFEGDVKDLGNHLGTGFNLETAIDMFNSDINLKGSDLVKKVYQKLNNTSSMPYNWCEDLDEYVENHEDFKEALIDQEIKLSKKGWKFNNYTIINNKLKEKASDIEFSERLSVLEYGKFKIKTDPIDVNTFDSLGLMWWIDHDIMDMGGFNNLTKHVYDNEYKEDKIYSYKFSKVFYSDEKDGISELDFTIHDMDIMDITCQLSWAFDD